MVETNSSQKSAKLVIGPIAKVASSADTLQVLPGQAELVLGMIQPKSLISVETAAESANEPFVLP